MINNKQEMVNSFYGRVFSDLDEVIEEYNKLTNEEKRIVRNYAINLCSKPEWDDYDSRFLGLNEQVYRSAQHWGHAMDPTNARSNAKLFRVDYSDCMTDYRKMERTSVADFIGRFINYELPEIQYEGDLQDASAKLLSWLSSGGSGLPYKNLLHEEFEISVASWLFSTYEFTPNVECDGKWPFALEAEALIERFIQSKVMAEKKKNGGPSNRQRRADGNGNPIFGSPLGRKTARLKTELEDFFFERKLQDGICFSRDELGSNMIDSYHLFDLLPDDLIRECIDGTDVVFWAEQAWNFIFDRDEDGLRETAAERLHRCNFTGTRVPAPLFSFTDGSFKVAAMNVDKWRTCKRRAPGTVAWVKSIPLDDRLNIIRSWITGMADIDGYNCFVDRLAPTKQTARVTAHRSIELSKVEGYVDGASQSMDAALFKVLEPLQEGSEEELRLVSKYMDVRAVFGVRFDEGTVTDRMARLDRDLKPIFVGNCIGDVVHVATSPGGETAIVPGLKRGICTYPWIHKKVVDHDVASASIKIADFDLKAKTLDLDIIGIEHVGELAVDYFEDGLEMSFYGLSYNERAVRVLVATSRKLEELRALTLQILSSVNKTSEKMVLLGGEYENITCVTIPDDWKPKLLKAVSKVDENGKARRPKPQIEYFEKLINSEWYFTVDADGRRRFADSHAEHRDAYLRNMNLSLYVVGLVRGELVSRKRFPALAKPHLKYVTEEKSNSIG